MSEKTATVTSKGQVTIPAEIRDYMDVKTGDQLLFVRDAGRVYVERLPSRATSDEVFGILHRAGQTPLTWTKPNEARAKRARRQSESLASNHGEQRRSEVHDPPRKGC